jgi:ATP-dependent helicase/nuclease subunit A
MESFGKILWKGLMKMADNWTIDQRKAIETEGCNVLVSAAAGSGKTAVLVERIIQKITAPEKNIDIDRLVVVTFTKAAAAEMKQRIRESIDKLLEQQEGINERLQKQLTLLNNAQITTIDSFCLNIVRNYFADIDIDPGFRTADEGEIKLLENDVMEEMLEDYYAMEDSAFFDFVDAYGNGKDDSAIEDIIHRLYQFARSYPWPDEWFDACLDIYQIENVEDMEQNPAILYLEDYLRRRFDDYDHKYSDLEQICTAAQGPEMYLAAVQSDHAAIHMLQKAETFGEMGRLIRLVSFDTLGRSKSKDIAEEKKEYVKAVRNEYKAFIGKLQKGGIFAKAPEHMIQDVKDNAVAVEMMVTLAREFSKRMQEQKRERNIIDFNDMEHLALDILVKRENGNSVYTESSDALSSFYEEILIDEYQDSNLLQEVILTAVSKGKVNPEHNNIYMVGDVKQSIYKFRLACPQLFIEKYNRYGQEAGPCVKIELQTNFRSRENVLESANDVFRRAMNPEFCGIEYDDKAKLNPGLAYPKSDDKDFGKEDSTKILLIDKTVAEGEEQTDRTDKELEAEAVAEEIIRLHDTLRNEQEQVVFDKNVSGGYRKIRYSDIVVLTRTVTGWADTFVNVLMNHGIPAYSDASEGYFNVREIRLILNYLTVIDNPLQDIPMAAVMLSFFGRFDADELTQIRMIDSKVTLYEAMVKLTGEQTLLKKEELTHNDGQIDDVISQKVECFLKKLDQFRRKSEIMAIYDLLWEVLYDTGYYNYTGTMPAGKRRQANLDILLTKAAAFEKTSYNGLFNFLRYLEKMQKFDVDFGEASMLGENEDIVRVMSIHKSKGLEFPVVIIAGMNKKMNQREAFGEVVIDQDLGVGTNVVRLDKRIKNPTFVKAAISRKLINDSISEELRVLYVAMTRAREKLIMTGTVKDADKQLQQWTQKSMELMQAGACSYSDVAGYVTYFDMVMPIACLPKEYNKGSFSIETIQMVAGETEQNETKANKIDEPEQVISEADEKATSSVNIEPQDKLVNVQPYRYALASAKKAKITVSELKKMQHDVDMDENAMYPAGFFPTEQEVEQVIPDFISGSKEKLAGNERGTAYHRVMECLNYSLTDSLENINSCIGNMVVEEKLTKNQADSVESEDIYQFCSSPIGQRVKAAWLTGQLKREQPFVFLDQQLQEEEKQLIQGVIDLYIQENNELIIVDYKTDRVAKGMAGEKELIRRYALQLDYYAKALQQMTQMKVKEKIIYSFALGKEISLP